jgi:hypothetical protein
MRADRQEVVVMLHDFQLPHAAGVARRADQIQRQSECNAEEWHEQQHEHGLGHTTALCSPSRAALLSGRNHHSVGTGVIIEMGSGYPGYTGTGA